LAWQVGQTVPGIGGAAGDLKAKIMAAIISNAAAALNTK